MFHSFSGLAVITPLWQTDSVPILLSYRPRILCESYSLYSVIGLLVIAALFLTVNGAG